MLRGLKDEWRVVHKSEPEGMRLSLEKLRASCIQMPTGQLPTAAAAKPQEMWDFRYPDE